MKRYFVIVAVLTALSTLAVWAATNAPSERPTYIKLTANLMVNDVNQALNFYEQVLGFETAFVVPEDRQEEMLTERPPGRALAFALLKAGSVEIMCQSRKSMTQEFTAIKEADPYASVTLYIEVKDVDRLYQRIQGRAQVLAGPLNKPYGKREITIRDINGYILTFSSDIEE